MFCFATKQHSRYVNNFRTENGSYEFVSDDPSHFLGYGYFDTCVGDSGGPVWLTISDEVILVLLKFIVKH